MLSGSEIILTATIWGLTGIGLGFGLRAKWRRRRRTDVRHTQER